MPVKEEVSQGQVVNYLRKNANYLTVGPWPQVLHDASMPLSAFNTDAKVMLVAVEVE